MSIMKNSIVNLGATTSAEGATISSEATAPQ
jgi:hypothetical protein